MKQRKPFSISPIPRLHAQAAKVFHVSNHSCVLFLLPFTHPVTLSNNPIIPSTTLSDVLRFATLSLPNNPIISFPSTTLSDVLRFATSSLPNQPDNLNPFHHTQRLSATSLPRVYPCQLPRVPPAFPPSEPSTQDKSADIVLLRRRA